MENECFCSSMKYAIIPCLEEAVTMDGERENETEKQAIESICMITAITNRIVTILTRLPHAFDDSYVIYL